MEVEDRVISVWGAICNDNGDADRKNVLEVI